MRFLITGAPRSGTNYLSNMINYTDVSIVKGESMFYSDQFFAPSLWGCVADWLEFAAKRKYTWSSEANVIVTRAILDRLIPDDCGEHSTVIGIKEMNRAVLLFDKVVYIRRDPNQCVESFHKLWAKQIREDTPSALKKTKLFIERDYPELSAQTRLDLIADIEDVRNNLSYLGAYVIDYDFLITEPLKELNQVIKWLFDKEVDLLTLSNAVDNASADKFSKIRPEHFS